MDEKTMELEMEPIKRTRRAFKKDLRGIGSNRGKIVILLPPLFECFHVHSFSVNGFGEVTTHKGESKPLVVSNSKECVKCSFRPKENRFELPIKMHSFHDGIGWLSVNIWFYDQKGNQVLNALSHCSNFVIHNERPVTKNKKEKLMKQIQDSIQVSEDLPTEVVEEVNNLVVSKDSLYDGGFTDLDYIMDSCVNSNELWVSDGKLESVEIENLFEEVPLSSQQILEAYKPWNVDCDPILGFCTDPTISNTDSNNSFDQTETVFEKIEDELYDLNFEEFRDKIFELNWEQ
jgi:hypothetical protein